LEEEILGKGKKNRNKIETVFGRGYRIRRSNKIPN